MSAHQGHFRIAALAGSMIAGMLLSTPAIAHCDTMDGPVVKDAQKALAGDDITPVLKWIPKEDEDAIREVFDMTSAVRSQSEEVRHVADRYFFETLVRVHRASEGEAYTGLKSSGIVDPAIAAADRALEDGNIGSLADDFAMAVREEIEQRFAKAYEKRQAAEDSVEEGRDYVAAYVQLTHFVEGLDYIVGEGAGHLVPHGINQKATRKSE